MHSLQQWLADPYAGLVARTVVALVLLIASLTKLGNPHEFVEVVGAYRLLPESLVGFVGRLLPVIEIVVAVGLLLGLIPHWLLLAAIGLFLLFGSAIAINLLRGRRDISCGCFGPQRNRQLTWGLVARNAGLAGLTGVTWSVSSVQSRAHELSIAETVATMLVAGAALASWWLWGVILKLWHLPEVKSPLSHDQPQ